MFKNENIYKNNSNIKYYFQESEFNCDKLIVIFSGYADINSEIKHKYNYINSLRYINCHKLFILDNNGETGSYYLGEKLNFDVESSIISLILDTTSYLGLSVKDIIGLGSSKGGSAALYFGLKYKFGTIISGGFQTKISDLISKRRPESEDFLLGQKGTDEYNEKYHKLNNIIFEQLDSPIRSDMYLMTSEHDWQYNTHVLPFIKYLDDMKIEYHLEKSEEMKNHSQISTYFPKFFNIILLKILYGIELKDLSISSNDCINVNLNYINNNNSFNLKIYSKVDSEEHLHDNNGNFHPKKPGHYSTYLIVTDNNENEHYRYLINQKFNGASYYDILSTNAKIENEVLYYEVQTTNKDEVTFAFYIYENDEMVEFIPFQKNNNFKRVVEPINNYMVKCYIKSKEGTKVVIKDHPIIV